MREGGDSHSRDNRTPFLAGQSWIDPTFGGALFSLILTTVGFPGSPVCIQTHIAGQVHFRLEFVSDSNRGPTDLTNFNIMINISWLWRGVVIGAFAECACALNQANAATSYDLRGDWSDSSNSNGVWSYRAANVVLPHISNWTFDTFSSPQGGWANGESIPFWFRSSSTPLSTPYDWQPGDVVVHTQDNTNGADNGPANVVWTSPSAGTISITDGVWEGRDFPDLGGGSRGNTWSLYLDNTLLSSGVIKGGDGYSRANPFTFNLGSGGAAVLQNLHVVAGDEIRLELDRTGFQGDYVGVNLGITVIPEPSSPAVAAVGVLLWIFFFKKKASSQGPALRSLSSIALVAEEGASDEGGWRRKITHHASRIT
jgi:hypothetical protein